MQRGQASLTFPLSNGNSHQRPWVSSAVEDESYDDITTPDIRLTPIEDDQRQESSHNSTGLGPDLSLAASAALSAFMKTKEQGSLVDADLLVKLLSGPNIIKNLMNNDTIGKSLEEAASASITNPRLAPQHDVTMDRNPPHVLVSLATSPPLTLALSMNLQKPPPVFHTFPLPRLEDSYATSPLKPSPLDDVVVSEQKTPQSQSLNIPTLSTWNMNKVTEPDPQNINRDAKPVKNIDYFKNLIREHGGVVPATHETNNYKRRADNVEVVKGKVQKPCMYFGRARGCKLGESCLYLHDRSKRLWPDAASQFPNAK